MNNNLRLVLLGCLVLTLVSVSAGYVKAGAVTEEIPPLAGNNLRRGVELFGEARKIFYNGEAPVDEVMQTLEQSKEFFAGLPGGFDKYYWLAGAAFLSGEAAEAVEDRKQAAGSFTESGDLTRKALDLKPDSSDARRLLADSIMRLMSYKGIMYMMTQGPQVLNLLKEALSLDEKNYTAMNSLGIYYLNAPAIGGGSVDKAIEILHKALGGGDQFDNFISHVWLGNAYQKKNNAAEAVKRYHNALQIYPNSPWVKDLLAEIE